MEKPVIFGSGNLEELKKIKAQKNIEEIDFIEQQLEELFYIQNPSLKLSDDKVKLQEFINSKKDVGNWVYFPWSNKLIHILQEEDFFQVRTNRNKNIITKEEQQKLSETNIAVLGMSIGNGMAISLAYSGISDTMKLADFDTLDLSNLNRLRSGVQYLGKPKIEITAQQIYEINPYANLVLFEKGVSPNELNQFVVDKPKPNLIFEEIDDFEIKIRVRIKAKEARVPVIMLTNLGDRLLIDVERYDLDADLPIFNGLIGKTPEEILSKPISEDDKKKYAIAIVGRENLPHRVFESVLEVNKTLVGRPQVMSTVTIGAGIAAFLVRKLVLGNLPSGRKMIDFNSLI